MKIKLRLAKKIVKSVISNFPTIDMDESYLYWEPKPGIQTNAVNRLNRYHRLS